MKGLAPLTILIAGFLLAFTPGKIPTQGLVAHYAFTENTNDATQHQLHGKVIGATATEDRFGNENQAYRFDGNRDYIRIPNNEQFSMQQITVSCWIKLDREVGHTQARIINQQETGRKAWGLEVFGSQYGKYEKGHQIAFHCNNGDAGRNMIAPTRLKIGRWYHVVATNDGNMMAIYINGQLDVMMKSLGPVYNTINSDIVIGRTAPVAAYFFPGAIDDVLVYNRALSEKEIKALFQF